MSIKNLANAMDPNVKARDIKHMASKTSNIYESITVISKRARQLSAELKKELHDKLEEFVVVTETIEEIHENKEQIEISRSYEKMASPTILATEEFLNGDLEWRYPEPVVKEDDFTEETE
ncbi:MAG TPA: DNA-directed RNA polymerase subunit omega [Saprospiraceae bacterium]|nr:DNA-directed RNA polymerase subunit omega [Saprospiraceae bacterium]